MRKNKKRRRRKRLTAKEKKKELLRLIKLIFIAVGVVILLKAFAIDISLISGNSMSPSLADRDFALIKKWDIHFSTKGSGIDFYDVVAISNIENAEGEKENTIKRIIGLPGDSIKIVNGTVHRNGQAIEDLAAVNIDTGVNIQFKVSEGRIFVLGDNRSDSWDSVDFGVLPINKVTGVVLFK